MGIDIDIIPYIEQHGIAIAPFGTLNVGRRYLRDLIDRIPSHARGPTPKTFFLAFKPGEPPNVCSNEDMYGGEMRSVPLRNFVGYLWKNIEWVKADKETNLFKYLFHIEEEWPHQCRAAFFWW